MLAKTSIPKKHYKTQLCYLYFMKKHLVLLFVLTVFGATAQKRGYQFGFSNYTFASFPLYIADASAQQQVDALRNVEIPKLGFGVKGLVAFRITKRWVVHTGLGYLNYGAQTKKYAFDDFSFPDEIDSFYGFVLPAENAENLNIRFIYTIHSLEIPLAFRYQLKNRFYIDGGASLLAQLANKSTYWQKIEGKPATRKTTKDNKAELEPINMAINASFGYTLFQHKKANAFVALRAQHVAFGVMQNVPINRKYITGGIEIGVLF